MKVRQAIRTLTQVLQESAQYFGCQGILDILDEERCDLLACQVVNSRRRGTIGWLLLHDDTPAGMKGPLVPWRALAIRGVADDIIPVWTREGSERMQQFMPDRGQHRSLES